MFGVIVSIAVLVVGVLGVIIGLVCLVGLVVFVIGFLLTYSLHASPGLSWSRAPSGMHSLVSR